MMMKFAMFLSMPVITAINVLYTSPSMVYPPPQAHRVGGFSYEDNSERIELAQYAAGTRLTNTDYVQLYPQFNNTAIFEF